MLDRFPHLDTALSDMVAEKFINALPGQREIPSPVSYAASSFYLNTPEGLEAYEALSEFGTVPVWDATVPDGPVMSRIPSGAEFYRIITEIEGYYLVQAQKFTLQHVKNSQRKPYIPPLIQNSCFIEVGPGDGTQTYDFFKMFGAPAYYIGVDIASEHLDSVEEKLKDLVPEIKNFAADFSNPHFVNHPLWQLARSLNLPIVVNIDSTLGNIGLEQAKMFLSIVIKNLRREKIQGRSDSILLYLDSTKYQRRLERAYGQRICAMFHLRGLLDSFRFAGLYPVKFPLKDLGKKFIFEYEFDSDNECVNQFLVSRVNQIYGPRIDPSHMNEEWRRQYTREPLFRIDRGERLLCIQSAKWGERTTLRRMFKDTGAEVSRKMSYIRAMRPANPKINFNCWHLVPAGLAND